MGSVSSRAEQGIVPRALVHRTHPAATDLPANPIVPQHPSDQRPNRGPAPEVGNDDPETAHEPSSADSSVVRPEEPKLDDPGSTHRRVGSLPPIESGDSEGLTEHDVEQGEREHRHAHDAVHGEEGGIEAGEIIGLHQVVLIRQDAGGDHDTREIPASESCA
jgi:hypothetical protein